MRRNMVRQGGEKSQGVLLRWQKAVWRGYVPRGMGWLQFVQIFSVALGVGAVVFGGERSSSSWEMWRRKNISSPSGGDGEASGGEYP